MKYLKKKWLWIVIGVAATAYCLQKAYQERGYIAVGGEWLVLGMVLVIGEIAGEMRRTLEDAGIIRRNKKRRRRRRVSLDR